MQNVIDFSSTTFMLVCSAFVMLMTPGLALFYGGMVRRKNVLHTVMLVTACMSVVTLQWVLIGYSLSFAPGNGFIGSLKWIGLKGVGLSPNPLYSSRIPHLTFMIFQAMFAIITPALIAGAIVERVNLLSFLLFVFLWTTIVYCPVSHWVWGSDGWLRNFHVLDFAGGLVVHLSSGSSALAAAILLGKRKGLGNGLLPPYNVSITVLGAALLWFGWFGFNAGSALEVGAISTLAFVNTHIAAAVAGLSYLISEKIIKNKPTTLGFATGIIAGLVAITPACGFVTPIHSVLIGLVSGPLAYLGINLKSLWGYDDSLDVVGVHGVNGAWGALATGLFANKTLNALGANGLFYGNPLLFGKQFLSIIIVGLYSFILTYSLLKALSFLLPLRESENAEEIGLDISTLGEQIY